jgi:hypothetical protein
MATTRARAGAQQRRPGTNGTPVVPRRITVARFQEATKLVERLVEEKQDVFLAAGQRFRARHREQTNRPLTHEEAAQVAAALLHADGDRLALAERIQASELRAYDEPTQQEILVAAGVATAPAFFDVALRFTALMDLPDDEFEEAFEAEQLETIVEEHARALQRLDMDEGRRMAAAALERYSQAASGRSSGEAWGLLTRVVGQAFIDAMTVLSPNSHSGSSSLTGSPPPTDGPEGTSSTTSPGETP